MRGEFHSAANRFRDSFFRIKVGYALGLKMKTAVWAAWDLSSVLDFPPCQVLLVA